MDFRRKEEIDVATTTETHFKLDIIGVVGFPISSFIDSTISNTVTIFEIAWSSSSNIISFKKIFRRPIEEADHMKYFKM